MQGCCAPHSGYATGQNGNEKETRTAMDRLLALIAFAFLAAFLGILGWALPSPALVAVIALTIALAAFDFIGSSGKNS